MVISLPGVLERAAARCEKARDWQTKTLGSSLREPDRLQEFFDLWVDDKAAQAAERKG